MVRRLCTARAAEDDELSPRGSRRDAEGRDGGYLVAGQGSPVARVTAIAVGARHRVRHILTARPPMFTSSNDDTGFAEERSKSAASKVLGNTGTALLRMTTRSSLSFGRSRCLIPSFDLDASNSRPLIR
jgi:hypothetical protein